MDQNRERRRQNAERWGHIQEGHLRFWYDVDGFRRGKCSLRSIEREALGDVSGLRVLHLQCNCGLDSLSLARLGAEVTGVDLSAKNIDFARELSAAVAAGLVIERLGEYPVAAYRWRKDLVKGEDGWWRLPGIDYMPQTLSVRAGKPPSDMLLSAP